MILTAIKGDTTIFEVTITDQDNAKVNLTGSTVFFTVKTHAEDDDDDALITQDVVNHSDPTNGITQIVLSDTQTNIAPGSYYYDIQVKSSVGYIQSIIKDKFRVVQDVTVRKV